MLNIAWRLMESITESIGEQYDKLLTPQFVPRGHEGDERAGIAGSYGTADVYKVCLPRPIKRGKKMNDNSIRTRAKLAEDKLKLINGEIKLKNKIIRGLKRKLKDSNKLISDLVYEYYRQTQMSLIQDNK